MIVCFIGNLKFVKEFLKVGDLFNLINENGILFIIVCEKKYINVVEELIKVGVDVNFEGGGRILLIVVFMINDFFVWYDLNY